MVELKLASCCPTLGLLPGFTFTFHFSLLPHTTPPPDTEDLLDLRASDGRAVMPKAGPPVPTPGVGPNYWLFFAGSAGFAAACFNFSLARAKFAAKAAAFWSLVFWPNVLAFS